MQYPSIQQPNLNHTEKKPFMPSLLNPYLSRLSTAPQRQSPQQQPKLSSEHIDLWEHAALLYHHFEWQSAIETFQHLALSIPIEAKEPRTLCLLNAAIIQARLGDYAHAAATLEGAARTDGSFILTPFLLGIMEWELGNLIKAEACLEISLLALRRHKGEGDVDFSPYGLDFRLRGEVVREVLRRLRGVNLFSEEAQSINVGFAGFSADFIFEAPVREGGNLEEEEDLPIKRQEEQLVLSARGGKVALRNRPPDSLPESSPKPTTKNPRESFQELKAFLRGEHKPTSSAHRPISRTSAAPPADPPRRRLPHPLPAATATAAEATYHSTWRRRPPTPYIPRDARGEYHSVGELARFIRRYRNQTTPMSPRDPRGEAESTGELARFIRCAGGGGEGGLRMPFLEGGEGRGGFGGGEVESLLDLYLYRGDGIGLGGGGGGGVGGDGGDKGGEEGIPRRHSDPIPAHTAPTPVTGGIRNRISTNSTTPTSSHFPRSSSPRPTAETPNFLHPNIYDDGTCPSHTPITDKNKPSTPPPISLQLLDSSRHHRRTVEEEDNPLARFHTAGSETSSLFRHSMVTVERAEIARGEALRRLEGRARGDVVKPLKSGVGGVGRESGKIDDGGRGENGGVGGGGGGGPPITNIAYYDNDAVDDTVDTMVEANVTNKISDGKVMLPTTTTTTTTKTGMGELLPPSHSKPLPPGPPRGKAGRFEVFLADGYPDRRKDAGGERGGGGGGDNEEEKEEGNAVRVPSSKIFEYMSRG
ncbi:hypothetical protein D0869_01084 [Hortaea werneckii]|uniref:Uncharacterized protein n=1 Tax=Hortaea werneckii TaxID=91943 RepID=A0A3M6XER1_HORWE|nr:hypothetical protein D0869_01084 [Hortaea werneckii]